MWRFYCGAWGWSRYLALYLFCRMILSYMILSSIRPKSDILTANEQQRIRLRSNTAFLKS